MSSNIVITTVIPTYNRAHCLDKTLQSVISKTVKNQEVIVIDDGSGDDTEGVVKKYPEVRYHRLEGNYGVSFARNYGIRKAQGRYICFLDSWDCGCT